MHYSEEIRVICQQNSLEALEAFIQQQRQSDPGYSPPLRVLLEAATDWRADKIAAYCLENGETAKAYDDRRAYDGVMTSVVVNDSFAVYRLLVEHKAVDINYYVPWYGDILSIMAFSNQLDRVEFCLEHGADPNRNLFQEYLSALACATETGNMKMVDSMIQHGAKVTGSNAIVQAAINENLDLLRYLLSKGADIDEIGIKGQPGDEDWEEMGSPLHHAAKEGYTEMALFLIGAGANIHLKDPLGRTAEDLARVNNHTEILSALRQQKTGVL
ncbi:ankyrin repeat-containing domain protein [Aspergillus karnatakaensis]|uniref:ankyrin repeat domain-containing protein n=1 Tax=Aspergillus karnatakaensis TaxID=1810916 RepID=UPI003CCDD8B1